MPTANAINLTVALTVTNGNLYLQRATTGAQYNMSGGTVAEGVISIPTTAGGTALVLTASSQGGVGYWKNLDVTNFVQIGVVVSATFYPVVQIGPGQVASFPIATTSLYARADTAAVILDYTVFAA